MPIKIGGPETSWANQQQTSLGGYDLPESNVGTNTTQNDTSIKPLENQGTGAGVKAYNDANPGNTVDWGALKDLQDKGVTADMLTNIGSLDLSNLTGGPIASTGQLGGVAPGSGEPRPPQQDPTLGDTGAPATYENYDAYQNQETEQWANATLEQQLAGAVDGTWLNNGLSDFFDQQWNTELDEGVRQQIAQAYATRGGMPYVDPINPVAAYDGGLSLGGAAGPTSGTSYPSTGTQTDVNWLPPGYTSPGFTDANGDAIDNQQAPEDLATNGDANSPTGGLEGDTDGDGVISEEEFLQWLNTQNGQDWANNQGGTNGTGGTGTGQNGPATNTGGQNNNDGGTTVGTGETPTPQSGDGVTTSPVDNEGNWTSPANPDSSRYSFKDMGDGTYRGPKGVSGGAAENTVQADGSVQGNYSNAMGNEFRGTATTANEMTDQEVAQAEAAFAAENGRQMTEEEKSSMVLNDILKTDSPLMQLARQDGINFANSRGLMNSSLAAGASMAEMTRQATPLAMQQAQAATSMEAQNQGLESDRREQNATREQQESLFNAQSENTATGQEFQTEAQRRATNAATMTDVSMGNASMGNDMLNADRQRRYGYNLQQLAGDQDYAKQELASQSAVDIANIEGQYKQFISENDTAARLYDSTYNAIADILSDPKMHADEATAKINYMTQTMEQMMETLLGFGNLDLGDPVV